MSTSGTTITASSISSHGHLMQTGAPVPRPPSNSNTSVQSWQSSTASSGPGGGNPDSVNTLASTVGSNTGNVHSAVSQIPGITAVGTPPSLATNSAAPQLMNWTASANYQPGNVHQAASGQPYSQTTHTNVTTFPLTAVTMAGGMPPKEHENLAEQKPADPDAERIFEEESEEESVSEHGTSSATSEDKDSEDEEAEIDVGETTSAVSKVSNRSSPSVLSATIHHWPGYEEESHGLLENNEEVSEDSENEDPDDPWRIQPEQQGWYLTLFLRLQPDVHGYIEGKDARVFFENSQLPLHDLGEIWNCSDVDRDGRLTLAEFCYAMHMSVARRHGMTLPSQLPPSLRNSTRPILKAAQQHTFSPSTIPAGDNPHQPAWTKFSESPRNRGPVQFRTTVDGEKNLPHPVAVRLPTKSAVNTPRSGVTGRDARSYSAGTVAMPSSLSLAGSGMVTASGSNVSAAGGNGYAAGHEAVMAPPPPPRSWHSRSASLDLQGQPTPGKGHGSQPTTGGPPQLPPRSSPVTSRRLDSNTSESENESRYPVSGSGIGLSGSASETKPDKPPRVTKTPVKNVSFAPSSAAGGGVSGLLAPSVSSGGISFDSAGTPGWDRSITISLPPNLDVGIPPIPTSDELEKMSSSEVATLVERLKITVEGLSRQNVDLQHQLTDVVLKKRTAEAGLAAERSTQKQ